eukprot:m.19157 g.19157  ORF g.19157 m.19157 type:complete len:508 (+) comp7525_c0_seq1:1527-3050(+)
MPPKKDKKKSKGKKGKKKDKLSSNEKFLQLRISHAIDGKKALEEKKASYVKDLPELEHKLGLCAAERDRIIKLFRLQAQDIDEELHEAEKGTVGQMREAIQAKHQAFREQESLIAEMQQEIVRLREQLEETKAEEAFLIAYRETEQHTFAQQIQALSASIVFEKEAFERDMEDLPRQFSLSNEAFLQQLEQTIEHARHEASSFAMSTLNAKERGQWSDVQWLLEELDRHTLESARLTASCEALESENLRLLRRSSVTLGACPEWWETAASYREHAERARLESMLTLEEDEEETGEGEAAADHQSYQPPPRFQLPQPPSETPVRRPRLSLTGNNSTPLLILSPTESSANSVPTPSTGRPSSRTRISPGRPSLSTFSDVGSTVAPAVPSITANLSALPPVRRRTSLLFAPSPSPSPPPRGSLADMSPSIGSMRRSSTLSSLHNAAAAAVEATPPRRASTFALSPTAPAPAPALAEDTQARLDRLVLFPRLARQSIASIRSPRLSMTEWA